MSLTVSSLGRPNYGRGALSCGAASKATIKVAARPGRSTLGMGNMRLYLRAHSPPRLPLPGTRQVGRRRPPPQLPCQWRSASTCGRRSPPSPKRSPQARTALRGCSGGPSSTACWASSSRRSATMTAPAPPTRRTPSCAARAASRCCRRGGPPRPPRTSTRPPNSPCGTSRRTTCRSRRTSRSAGGARRPRRSMVHRPQGRGLGAAYAGMAGQAASRTGRLVGRGTRPALPPRSPHP